MPLKRKRLLRVKKKQNKNREDKKEQHLKRHWMSIGIIFKLLNLTGSRSLERVSPVRVKKSSPYNLWLKVAISTLKL